MSKPIYEYIVEFRCVDAEAYEMREEDVSNGIFISFLKRHICQDEKVTVMLDRVAEGALNCVYSLCHLNSLASLVSCSQVCADFGSFSQINSLHWYLTSM